ncbi:hypothetical protein DTO027B5_6596 [Paecilomyces variotii]|nr:hypothetical protein DTO169C6_549 [Paecilomyces variotii]KAJ9262294.1 hypothetical protein DTO195F2_3681 [Paecilomyces variotii]KAJ9285401.1 hypothetical protein DTO021C3_7065 [Paecilomyces variotii]KAJ9329869.1 hypothetical protein DTO027B3_356 [Paecilomyces variotii]KAJ9331639.1 hypothetical protein DTO027B5_6596 [Paecilomyces variotii]
MALDRATVNATVTGPIDRSAAPSRFIYRLLQRSYQLVAVAYSNREQLIRFPLPDLLKSVYPRRHVYNLSRPELKPSPKGVSDIHPSSRADVVPGRFPGKLYLLEQFSHSLVPEHSELTMLYCGRTLAPALPN